ncbi:hypothetical protein ABZW02_12575 [Streptomyces sp. NPDC005180]|uniref:hypothetical protein n=1 Tax=Streptomyces sp. NPDC005180 TaxID=3156868 RepID=UPI0033BB350F
MSKYADFEGLRARARELRLQGLTYDRIQLELGCSKSSISLWVRDLPKPPAQRTAAEQARFASRKRWDHENAVRDEARRQTKESARSSIGQLDDRELFIAGVTLYWAEGSKDKAYDRRERVQFVNSDPGVIQVFLAWLDLIGVERQRIRYRVMIHESADIAAAEEYWTRIVGAEPSQLAKTTLKKPAPKTTRKNVGENYRGRLVVYVSQSADIYRRIEGAWYGIVGAASTNLDTQMSGSG